MHHNTVRTMAFGSYGYSVWYVPTNWRDIKEKYNMTHIPHITLETNLILRDAYHIYHNACPKVLAKLKPDCVTFPQLYAHDPLQARGWYVDILQMNGRKLSWTPHMSVTYTPRNLQLCADIEMEPVMSHAVTIAPSETLECFVVIADTRSVHPEEWHIGHKYFNIKVTNSGSVFCGIQPTDFKKQTIHSLDEYIGVCNEELSLLNYRVNALLETHGCMLPSSDVIILCNSIRDELLCNDNMEVETSKTTS